MVLLCLSGTYQAFLDIYLQYDLDHGTLTEELAQELIDQFVIKLRMVRHLRMDSYNEIFAGDPTWVTESIGGRLFDGRHKVTKTSFRSSRLSTTSVQAPSLTSRSSGVPHSPKASRSSLLRYLLIRLLSSTRMTT